MTFYYESETDDKFDFNPEEIMKLVIREVLDIEKCPYETQVNLLLTNDAGIHEFNREHRGVDAPTDVLSFPNIDYEEVAVFEIAEQYADDCFDPDSGELILGDIILNADRVRSQAIAYGHSEKREFAFLIAHSMLHLCGYDHMTEEDAAIMEEKQRLVMEKINITRD